MVALYLDDVGQKRFDVVQLLRCEYGTSLENVKLMLVGVRVKLMMGDISELQALQERLEELGAKAAIELATDDEVGPDIEIGPDGDDQDSL